MPSVRVVMGPLFCRYWSLQSPENFSIRMVNSLRDHILGTPIYKGPYVGLAPTHDHTELTWMSMPTNCPGGLGETCEEVTGPPGCIEVYRCQAWSQVLGESARLFLAA